MTPTPKQLTAWVETFHNHLDACSQCRNHPGALCMTGARLLTLRDVETPKAESPTLEALTSPRQTLTETLLGIDPTEAANAGSIYRQDDDPFEGVEVEEDGDEWDPYAESRIDGRDMEVVNCYASTCDLCAELTHHDMMTANEETQLGYCGKCVKRATGLGLLPGLKQGDEGFVDLWDDTREWQDGDDDDIVQACDDNYALIGEE